MNDRDLAAQAFVLIEEAQKKVPLKQEEWEALRAEVCKLADKASSPEDILDVTAEQLEWLKPGAD